MKYVGIDACKSGWVAVILGEDREVCEVYSTIADMWNSHKDAQRIFIDIPVGLAAHGDRLADAEMRRALPRGFKSSIFNTPVRDAVHARSKGAAKSINKKLTGKSLSEQSLGICQKIREVDLWLQDNRSAWERIHESHPEACFYLCAGHALGYGKKDFLGSLERLRIIEKHIPRAERMLMSVRNEHSRTNVAADDVLDAMILAVTARECKGVPHFFPAGLDEPPRDETGLPMAIWYHDFTNIL